MSYDIIPISTILLVAYLGSYLLYHNNYIKKSIHIRLWNILILVTFLVSAGAGLILLILAEYGIALPISQSLLYWHVQFAIAMFWIALFHIHSYWMSSTGEKSNENIGEELTPSTEKSSANSDEKSGKGLK
jgi:hypothetical protein